jgi:hypothetical protein
VFYPKFCRLVSYMYLQVIIPLIFDMGNGLKDYKGPFQSYPEQLSHLHF